MTGWGDVMTTAMAEVLPVDYAEPVLLTLRAYRVQPDGTRVEVAPRQEITSAQKLAPLASGWWPPCECPRCMPGLHLHRNR